MTFNALKFRFLQALLVCCAVSHVTASEGRPETDGCVTLPNATNAVQFRLYTSVSPTAAHLFNTFDVEVDGAVLVRSPGGDAFQRSLAARVPDVSWHSVVVNGKGPELAASNGMRIIEQTSGPEWRYVEVDASAAYRGQVKEYRRGILFIEPDLFVLYDHVVAREPMAFLQFLHPPAASRVDPIWGDLHLEGPSRGLVINAPGVKGILREWRRLDSPADRLLPGTVTMEMGPTNKLAEIDLVTVFAVSRPGAKDQFAFKLIEGNSAVGARIHRDGLPTMVAFKLDAAATNASLNGFGFSGPAGVSVFKPKKKLP